MSVNMKRILIISAISLFLTGCAGAASNPGPHMLAVKDLPVVGVGHKEVDHGTQFQSTHPITTATDHDNHSSSQHATAHSAGHGSPGSSPSEALSMLVDGNERFMQGKSIHPSQDSAYRASLAKGQKPKAIILSCSDSRVSPEILFDRGLGELFVIRSAGEVADAAGIASIEYALEHLGANLIVVLGHTSCGAVQAALSTPMGTSAGSPSLDTLVGHIRPHVASVQKDSADKSLLIPVKANVEGIAKSLSKNSKIIKEAIDSHHAKVVQGVYRLDTGKVDFWF